MTRPVRGNTRKFKEDPHWRDYLLFYEYFHGDTGAGVGASHQTGRSGAIARIMHLFSSFEANQILKGGKDAEMAATDQPGKKIGYLVWRSSQFGGIEVKPETWTLKSVNGYGEPT